MRPRGPRPVLRALCAILLAAPLLAVVSADTPAAAAAAAAAGGRSIGIPIPQPQPDANATDAAGSVPSVPPNEAAVVRGAPAAAAPGQRPPRRSRPRPGSQAAGPAPAAAPEAAARAGDNATEPAEAPADDSDAPDSDAANPDEAETEDAATEEAGIEDAEVEDNGVEFEEADELEASLGNRREVALRSPTLTDAFNINGGLIAVKTLSRFQERACSSTTSCDSAIVSALMVVVTACGAFVITHGATFLPDTRPRAEAVAMHIAEALSSGNTAATQTSVYRPPTGGQFRWPHFLHLYRTRDKNALRIGYNTILWIPALLWAAVAFGTTFIVTPAEVEFRLASPVYLAVTNAAEWGAVRFDGCNDVMWRVDDGVSPVMLRRTIRRCYDARRLASNELPRSQLPAAGPTASLLITSDFVRVAVLYENGAISTISRVSSRVVDLADRQPAAASPLRGGAGGGRTDISGMFLTSRIRLEALIPYFEAAMAQPEYEECGPPRFQFLEDDGSTFSGRWVFTCTPARGAELGVDGLLLAVFLRHTEYRFDSQRSGEEFEVFVPVRGLEGAPGEVIEVMGWGNGMLIGNVTVIWCNWLCSVIVAAVAVALAAITAAATAGLAKNLPTF